MSMTTTYRTIETKLIHGGELQPRIEGAVTMPIFQSSMYEYAHEKTYHDMKYIRLNNTPNHVVLHSKLAGLDGAEAGLVTASGMAAISTTLLTTLAVDDHLLVQSCLYGGTHDLLTKTFASLGRQYSFIDADDRLSWKAALKPNTKAIYVEAMSNPLLDVGDLSAVVEFARQHGLVSIIDNTFASPINFRPIERGFDLAVQSASKYLNGHSDIVGGVVTGSRETVERITHKLNHLGGSLDPNSAFLLNRGLKTLALRMRYQNNSALEIARFLQNHPSVEHVHYAGLESHPRHDRAAALFEGFGGVLSFELKGGSAGADRLLNRVKIPVIAPSLGGIQTLMTLPATTSHVGLSLEDRARLGITDGLIRVSVGIEAAADLIEDLDTALRGK
jgi:cystathionine beta-lyase/cystathionine gamma-synthase